MNLEVKEQKFYESQLVQIGLLLGQEKVISNGRIKYVRTDNNVILLGVEFFGLSGDLFGIIADLHSSLEQKQGDS